MKLKINPFWEPFRLFNNIDKAPFFGWLFLHENLM